MAKEPRKESADDLFRNFVIARYEKGEDRFEVLVKPDAVQKVRDGEEVNLMEELAINQVFRDAHKGSRASAERMKELFETDDPIEVARRLILTGDIQVTTDQRRQMLEKKRRQIVQYIAANAMNPQTGAPHPPARIEIAMEEAKVRIDPFKGIEEQVGEVLDALRPLLPIRFDKARIAVKLPAAEAPKCFGDIRSFGKVLKEEWQADGTWIGVVEMPAGMQTDFLERLNAKTKGNVESKILKPDRKL